MVALLFFVLVGIAATILGAVYAAFRLWWAWEDWRDSWFMDEED